MKTVRRHRDQPFLEAQRNDAMHGGEHGSGQQGHLGRVVLRKQPDQRSMHQRKRSHHHLKDIFRERPIILHAVFEQRSKQIRVLDRKVEIGVGKTMELFDRVPVLHR